MKTAYILVEGVNIYANLLDTNQLSIIRGGSFMLKDAIEYIAQDTNLKKCLTPISTGASSGLFLVTNATDRTELADAIATKLNNHEQYCLLPFIVESCQAEDLLEAKKQLQAQLRCAQMQSLTFVPDVKDEKEAYAPDQLEGRRIAIKGQKKQVQSQEGESRELSHSVYKRLVYGRKLRQSAYFKDETRKKCLDDYQFSDHFEDLAAHPHNRKLNGKIAVVYIDGNRFSQKQQTVLNEASEKKQDLIAAQQNFDQKIQDNRSEFLHTLLTTLIDEASDGRFNHATLPDQKIIRLETLLWGGDEMLFVLPAWLGFEFIQYFFEHTQDWKVGNETLTHAAGIVFCSAKTPIRPIRDFAQSIAESVKEADGGRQQNAWNYRVLESIDCPSNNDTSAFNEKHYGKPLANSKPPFLPVCNHWQTAMKETVTTLLNERLLPRRQLYRIVQIITAHDKGRHTTLSWEDLKNANKDPKNQRPLENQEIRLLQVSEDKDYLMRNLPDLAQQLFGIDIRQPEKRMWLWIHLYELWNYLCPEVTEIKREP